MQEKLYLEVKNHATGDHWIAACTVPVQIGKQHDIANQILLDPKYRTISRVHGMIEKTSRGYVYSDSSANGSRVGGLVVQNSRVALSPTFQIEIENYTITKVDVKPFFILSTTLELQELQVMELLPGRGIGVGEMQALRRADPQRVSAVEAATARHELVDLNRWTEWGLPLVGRFEMVEQQPVWIGDDVTPAAKNKAPIAQARVPLISLDVIEVAGTRFEVLRPNERRIVCGFDRCHLLNQPPLEANCRFCGRHLANSGGFSRLL